MEALAEAELDLDHELPPAEATDDDPAAQERRRRASEAVDAAIGVGAGAQRTRGLSGSRGAHPGRV